MSPATILYRTTRLANGLEIQAEIDPLAHTAAIGFFVRTGARDEPTELMGVSHFLEHMMFKGSEKRGAEDVNRRWQSTDTGLQRNTGRQMGTSKLTKIGAPWGRTTHKGVCVGVPGVCVVACGSVNVCASLRYIGIWIQL